MRPAFLVPQLGENKSGLLINISKYFSNEMAAQVTCSFYFFIFCGFLIIPNVFSNTDEVIGADDDDRNLGPSGYMKREYSAIKPFVGEFYCSIRS